MKQEEIRQLALRTAAGLGKGLLKGAGFAGKTALKGAGAAGKMLLKSTAAGLKSLSRMDRKDLATIGCIAAAATAVPVFLLAPGFATKEKKAPFLRRNFAHRGLHSRDLTVPENSLKAFELAAAAGYGIELDVQLSRDGQVVVFHDAELERVCGVKGKVEDLTFEELQELQLLHTEEKIPLFTDALAVIRGRGPLIVELKNGKRNKELCEKTYEILKNYKGDYCIESFNPVIVSWFRKHAKEVFRGQLAAPVPEYEGEVNRFTAYLLSHTLLNFLSRPHFIAYKIGRRPPSVRFSCALGAMNVGWTSHEVRNERGRAAVIFEFYRPRLVYRNGHRK
ncbi:MAG: glycerophosphodiester phosphodiesterase [Oscillospiraceae bacterium]|nr:glycerophosphodiester phosphodiesterase [Oscillospiraceae bacterium]